MSFKNPTFSERNGIVDVPPQMKLGELSDAFRSSLWRQFLIALTKNRYSKSYTDKLIKEMREIWVAWQVEYENRFLDTETVYFEDAQNEISRIFAKAPYNVLLDFIEHFYRHSMCPPSLQQAIRQSLEAHRSAYRIVDHIIVPISNEEEIAAIRPALEKINKSSAEGMKSHLSRSAKYLRDGDWAGSTRESINAVESAARFVEPDAKSLKDALSKLQKGGRIRHKALQGAFNQLYGYTSDEQGIRHALVFQDQADVNEQEAIFMFGACASFASYLLKIGCDFDG